MALQVVGLNPKLEVTLVIDHAQIVIYSHKFVMVSNQRRQKRNFSSLNSSSYFPWQLQLGRGQPGDPGDHAHLHVAVELKPGQEVTLVPGHALIVTRQPKVVQVS